MLFLFPLIISSFSPLEQFELYTIFATPSCETYYNTNLWFYFPQVFFFFLTSSNGLITIFIILFLIYIYFHTTFFHFLLIKVSLWMKGFEVYLNQIKQIIDDLIGHSLGKHYFFQFFSFVFILINIINFLGLIPYTFVLTSQFFFTFGVAFIFFITINITGLILHGVQFLKLFYPTGTPLFIVPLLILIEFVSYIARVFSLAIRLFANITAGHILIKILSWLTWMILDIIVLSSISFILISSLWVLEFFISILQAYVFLTLLCLYLNDVVELH